MERYITACPHTTITFTCSAIQVSSLTWLALPHLDEDDTIVVFALHNVYNRVINDVFNVTLVSVENIRGYLADIISVLSIKVDGIDNGTNVSCIVVSNTESRIILKQGLLQLQLGHNSNILAIITFFKVATLFPK